MFKVPLPSLLAIRAGPDGAGGKRSRNGRAKRGFPVFEITLVLALILIGWVAYRLYKIVPESDENRKQLNSLKSDYFQITAFVQSNLTELEGIVSNYFQTKDAAQLELFQTRC